MTAAFLQTELTTLISDSRKKYPDIKAAAESSLAELKAISVTSETQLAGDLVRKTSFVDPFLLASKSQNVKLASNGTACLQRLVASTAVPRSRLLDLLQAFETAVSLALEVQLKILQTLPSLLQLYAPDLHGEALSRILSVCADLSGNKLPLVSSTAGATFQQLLATVFAKAVKAPGTRSQTASQDAFVQEKEDAVAIFTDLCALLSGIELSFVRLDRLPPALILETVESLLSTYGTFVLSHQDVRQACAEGLVPGLLTLVEDSVSYPVVARAFRIAFILATQYLAQLKASMSTLLMTVLKMADRGAGAHKWKRVLSLEFCRGLCSDFDALRRSFAVYDASDAGTAFVTELMASLVRITSEDPSLIGLGRQSTVPSFVSEDTNAEATKVAELPSTVGSVGQADLSSTGLSVERSTIQTSCLDQYDKSTPPPIPDTYIFTLVLGSISAFADGMSKFIMPLSIPNRKSSIVVNEDHDTDEGELQRKGSLRSSAPDSQKYQQLINPLTRNDINKRSAVEECAKMIEACWPAILATCSTFLNAALDSYFYHMLIRTVQKLTQVSGVLELNTPRDALLTTLAKVSVPANVSSLMNAYYGGKPACRFESAQHNVEDHSVTSPTVNTPRQSIDLSSPNLNVRNLLCLRALLNLGIALGPTLSNSAWAILWQSLEQVEALMAVNASKPSHSNNHVNMSDGMSSTLASEISAVETARRRMVESTSVYSDSAFEVVCKSLFGMIEDALPASSTPIENTSDGTLRPKVTAHKSTRSVSGSWAKTTVSEIEVQFVLKSIGRLASVNLHRFRQSATSAVSWELIVEMLSLLQSNSSLQVHLRLQCANIIDAIVVESSSISSEEDLNDATVTETSDDASILQAHSIPALEKQIANVQYHSSVLEKSSNLEVQVVVLLLQALHNIVGSCGDHLRACWRQVFTILKSVTSHRVLDATSSASETSSAQAEAIAKLYSASFKVTHLISSDFLGGLDDEALTDLFALYVTFGSQKSDLNMSLTTIALYWNLAGVLNERSDLLEPFLKLPQDMDIDQTKPQVVLRVSTLWHCSVLGLQDHCKDARSDTRDAAVRMLTKVIEIFLPRMSAYTLNSYFIVVVFPLIDHYSQRDFVADSSWKDTTLKVLSGVVDQIQSNGVLLSEMARFRESWSTFLQSAEKLLYKQDVTVIPAVFSALTATVNSVLVKGTSEQLGHDRTALEGGWKLWLDYDPTKMTLNDQTEDAYASFAEFLLAMTNWNLEILSSFDDAVQIISCTVDRVVCGAVHSTYTSDVNKLSGEQQGALQILVVLKRLHKEDDFSHISHLLSIIRKLIGRSSTFHGGQAGKLEKGLKSPTGIAFATTCIERLRGQIQSRAASKWFSNMPFHAILETCTQLIKTKYSSLPINRTNPLWRQASLLATEFLKLIEIQSTRDASVPDLNTLLTAINDLLTAVLEIPQADRKVSTQPSQGIIVEDEEFDSGQLQAIHDSTHNIFLSAPQETPPGSQKHYVLTLFNHSLVAQPWYNDLTPDLFNHPLIDLTKIRLGSIRAPDLAPRQMIYPEALQCLFSLVKASDSSTPTSKDTTAASTFLPSLAAPYVLLRLAHTLKTFIADQPLRYLQHPHMALQHELHIVLRAFLSLRVSDTAFAPVISKLGLDTGTIRDDGKTHLRLMTGLLEKFEGVWRRLPRLKKGQAWQDYPDGVGVEECLAKWKEVMNESMTITF